MCSHAAFALVPVLYDVEVARQNRRQQLSGYVLRQPAHEPVCWQNEQAGVAHAHQHHQAEVQRGFVVRYFAGFAALFEVLHAGFVAVVAVGDEHRLRSHRAQ